MLVDCKETESFQTEVSQFRVSQIRDAILCGTQVSCIDNVACSQAAKQRVPGNSKDTSTICLCLFLSPSLPLGAGERVSRLSAVLFSLAFRCLPMQILHLPVLLTSV